MQTPRVSSSKQLRRAWRKALKAGRLDEVTYHAKLEALKKEERQDDRG